MQPLGAHDAKGRVRIQVPLREVLANPGFANDDPSLDGDSMAERR